MTRLDASNEPSMEDILASIRKIIAEDPPGSRPSPPAPAAAPQSGAFGLSSNPTRLRDTAGDSKPAAFEASPAMRGLLATEAKQPEPAATEPYLPEPYLKAAPVKPAPVVSAEPSSFFPKVSAPTPLRIEPSFDVSPAGAQLSVDAQLSDLLGDVLQAPLPIPAAADAVKAQSGFPANLAALTEPLTDAHAKAPVAQPAAAVEHRGGFTISRDGFQPPKADAPKTAAPAERDPFDFDLGPSPFEQKAAEKLAEPAPVAAPFGAVETVTKAEIAAKVEPVSEAASARAIEMPRPDEAVRAEAPAGDATKQTVAEPVVEAGRPFFVAAPSVAATLAPKSLAVEVAEKPVGPKAAEAVERDVISVVAQAETAADTGSQVPPKSTEAHIAQSQNTVVERDDARHVAVIAHDDAPALAEPGQRTMEDTVADLLRPMLRTWLAENMPRIVERALRREISEQLHSEHKTAAE